MDIANLTRYQAYVRVCDDGRYEVYPLPTHCGPYVKFEEAMEASSNSLQKIKAEIAAMCAEFISSRNGILKSGPDFRFVEKMRRLSAVQQNTIAEEREDCAEI